MRKKNGRKPKGGNISVSAMRKKAKAAADRAQELNAGKIGVRVNSRTVVYCHPEHIEKVKARYAL